MYVQIKKMVTAGLPLVFATFLVTGCGGSSGDESSEQLGAAPNKPDVVSSAVSADISSSTAESLMPVTSSAATTPVVPLPTSSANPAQSNSRISRAATSPSPLTPISDVTAPEPTELLLYRLSETGVTVTWADAVDDVEISHYKIKRDGEVISTASRASHIFSDQNLNAGTVYEYAIIGVDLSGNESSSPILTVRTPLSANGSTLSLSSKNASSIVNTSSKSSANATSAPSATPKPSSSAASASSKNSAFSSSTNSTSKSSLSSTSTASRKSSSSTKSTSSISSRPNNQITITWNHPTTRENKAFLNPDEIGGYEIRYRKPTDSHYTYLTLSGSSRREYVFDGDNDTEFEIAAFDINGVYGDFTEVSR